MIEKKYNAIYLKSLSLKNSLNFKFNIQPV